MTRTRTGHRATLLRTIDEVDDVVGTVHAGVVVWLAEPVLSVAERARFANPPPVTPPPVKDPSGTDD